MKTLSDADHRVIEAALGEDAEVFETAVVKLYFAKGERWEAAGIEGPCALVGEDQGYFFRLVDLDSGQVVYEQELYHGFYYTRLMPFFHVYEGQDSVVGFSFANETEAASFFSAASQYAADLGGNGSSEVPAGIEEQAQPTKPQPRPPARVESQGSGSSLQRPIPTPSPSPAAPVATPSPSVPAPSPSPSATSAPAASRSTTASKKEEKKGGFFSSVFGSSKQSKANSIEISGPRGFRHESHIGWDVDAGFEIRNIPPEWRKLFQAAGVKKSDLKDKETRDLIMSTVSESLAGNAPPPPSAPSNEPARAGPAPPPPPPPPSAPNAPKPPPPPMVKPADHSQQGSGGGGGGSSSSLLDQIRAGKELRSVDDQSALPSIETPQGQTLVDTLARALNNRRVNMMQDEEAPEGDDDWFEDDSDEDW